MHCEIGRFVPGVCSTLLTSAKQLHCSVEIITETCLFGFKAKITMGQDNEKWMNKSGRGKLGIAPQVWQILWWGNQNQNWLYGFQRDDHVSLEPLLPQSGILAFNQDNAHYDDSSLCQLLFKVWQSSLTARHLHCENWKWLNWFIF